MEELELEAGTWTAEEATSKSGQQGNGLPTSEG